MVFSIVIPLFNKENYIGNCLRSLLLQTYKDFEVIIVNDGSTDRSMEVVESFHQDLPIRVFKTENKGPAHARNFGVLKSSGDWLCFLDADDEYLPNHLEAIVNCDFLPEVQVISTNFYRGKDIPFIKCDKSIEKSFIEIFHGLSSPVNSSNSSVLRSAFIEKGGFNENLKAFEDWYCWWSLITEENYVFINKVTVRVNIVMDSLSRKEYDVVYLTEQRLFAITELKLLLRKIKDSNRRLSSFYTRKVNRIIMATLSKLIGNYNNQRTFLRFFLMLNLFKMEKRDYFLLMSIFKSFLLKMKSKTC